MLEPPRNKVAIIPIEDPDRTPGGLWIPDMAKQRVDQGIIKYRGKECKWLKVGWHVLFSGYTGDKVSLDGEGILYIMREEDVVARILDGEGQLFDLATIERIMETRLGELATRGVEEGLAPEAVQRLLRIYTSEITDRLSSLTTSEGFEF